MTQTTQQIHEMQAKPIKADERLYTILNNMGHAFDRKTSVGNFKADLVSFEHKIVIDIDGWWRAADEDSFIRDCWLKEQGFTVLKFWSFDIERNCQGVLKIIEGKLKGPAKEEVEG